MKTIKVYYCGWGERWLLGTLAHSGRDILFEYSAQSLERGLELSPFRLPLQQAAFSGFPAYQDKLPGLIADALPDGWGLVAMDRLFRKNNRDPMNVSPLDRLAFINNRTMGALVFEPSEPMGMAPADVDLLELAKGAQLVLAGKDAPVLKQLALLGGSPHGARPKVLVRFDPVQRTVDTSPDADGEPWLVKFQAQSEHKEVCAIEALYAQLAHESGLDVPPTKYFELDSRLSGFGIKRFDRRGGVRVPTLTLAGLLDDNFRVPSQDYSNFLRATRALTRDEREVEKAFARCVFNVILNNRDDHTKNVSFALNEHFEWKLAPCYDLTFSVGPGGWHQMSVMGEGVAPTGSKLAELAKDSGLKPAFVNRTIEQVSDVASQFAVQARNWKIRRPTVVEINRHIDKNLAAMRK
ncbi:MAG: type II toxin-antitoxin system HipA family toxin [Burkholderiaceae bacterium]